MGRPSRGFFRLGLSPSSSLWMLSGRPWTERKGVFERGPGLQSLLTASNSQPHLMIIIEGPPNKGKQS